MISFKEYVQDVERINWQEIRQILNKPIHLVSDTKLMAENDFAAWKLRHDYDCFHKKTAVTFVTMKIKITIKPNTPAEEMFQKYMEQKAEIQKKLAENCRVNTAKVKNARQPI